MEGETSDITLFLGRFHPLILHLPIGFLTMAFTLEVLSRFKRFGHFRASVGFVLLLGCGFAIIASALGYLLAQSGGYNEGLLSVHQWSGIGVAAISAVAAMLLWLYKRKPSVVLDRAYLAALSTMMLSLAVAGHYGGSLTHGSDYLSQHMPEGLRLITGMGPKENYVRPKITDLQEAVVYTDIIEPIFRTYCTSCHNESKSKGDLMMHTAEFLMKGGEGGAVLIPGNADESPITQRILLPESHEDHMPPEGKSQPSEEELDLLLWWVNAGAPFDKKVAEVTVTADVEAILEELAEPGAGKSEVELLLAGNVAPADETVLSQIRGKDVTVSALSDEIHWLQADVVPGANTDSILTSFAKIAEQLTWLNMGGSSVSDNALSVMGSFRNLTRLHLGNTEVTDEGLKHLQGLTYLESLNLYGTSVTDEGIQQLAALKNLKTLYLWQTRVTPEGAERLSKAIPGLQVNLGAEVSSAK